MASTSYGGGPQNIESSPSFNKTPVPPPPPPRTTSNGAQGAASPYPPPPGMSYPPPMCYHPGQSPYGYPPMHPGYPPGLGGRYPYTQAPPGYLYANPHPYRSGSSGLCRSFLLCLVVLVLGLYVGRHVWSLSLISPDYPRYTIKSFTVSHFNASNSMFTSGVWDTSISIENPNDDTYAYLRDFVVSVYYKNDPLAWSYGAGILLDENTYRETNVRLSYKSAPGNQSLVAKSTLGEMARERFGGSVTFSLKIIAVDAYVSYQNQEITYRTSIPPSYQGHKEVDVWSPFVYGTNVPVAPYNFAGLSQDQSNGNLLVIIKIDGRVRWKVGAFISGHYHIYVRCPAFITFGPRSNGIVVGNNAVKYQMVQRCTVSV